MNRSVLAHLEFSGFYLTANSAVNTGPVFALLDTHKASRGLQAIYFWQPWKNEITLLWIVHSLVQELSVLLLSPSSYYSPATKSRESLDFKINYSIDSPNKVDRQ